MATNKAVHPTDTEYLAVLQKKLFGRWVNQKLASRHLHVNDVCKDVDTSVELVALLEVLSEKTNDQKMVPKAQCKLRVQKIDNANIALKFILNTCGVAMSLKPSAENVVDGNETQILGLLWAVMLKYMKFGDDEEKLDAREALLMWVRNQVQSYKNVQVESLTKSFNNGLALCALIHKFRPKLINYESLDASNGPANLALAQDAAEKFFGLEKYLTPNDIIHLDEKSMLVYISEFYVGIAAQRKLDLAARRLTKLIRFTKINDEMRVQYNASAATEHAHVEKVMKVLNDRTIDNTMAGAKARLADFYAYKKNDKGDILSTFLSLESLYGNLARRLASHKRPAFQAAAGQSVEELRKAIANMEHVEAQRKQELHAELNRQVKLAKLNEQRHAGFKLLTAYLANQKKFLQARETVQSTTEAEYHLNTLAAFYTENKSTHASSVAELNALSDNLVSEKFEHSDNVNSERKTVHDGMAELDTLAAEKQKVLDDHLAREKFKARVRGWNEQHQTRHGKFTAWLGEKKAYLEKREAINSISEAEVQLNLLAAYEDERKGYVEASQPPLLSLGKDILAAKYETTYSQWSIENPQQVGQREHQIADALDVLTKLSATKLEILTDDLAREKFKEKLRQSNKQHIAIHDKIAAWVATSTTYLNHADAVDSIPDAESNLRRFEAYIIDKGDVTSVNVAALKKVGHDIVTAKYESKLSHYVFETPQEVHAREKDVADHWATLDKLGAAKKGVLDNDLARELKKEALRLEFANLARDYTKWTVSQSEAAGQVVFGFTLQEVQNFPCAAKNSAITGESDKKRGAADAVFAEAAGLGVKENKYTQLSPDTLKGSAGNLGTALAAKQKRYDDELARLVYEDNLCKEFAGLADPIARKIESVKNKIAEGKSDLDSQAQFVRDSLADCEKETSFPKIHELQGKIDSAGIAYNPHTMLTAADLDVQWKQFNALLNSKKAMFEEEIEHNKMRGLTKEQYVEIEEQFKQFDKSKNGLLEKNEFKACLYSLGHEKTGQEVIAVMAKYGAKDGKGMQYDGFKEFMINELGDNDSKNDINAGFKLLNKDADVCKMANLEILMEDADVAYLKQHMKATGDAYDFVSWTESVFAR